MHQRGHVRAWPEGHLYGLPELEEINLGYSGCSSLTGFCQGLGEVS